MPITIIKLKIASKSTKVNPLYKKFMIGQKCPLNDKINPIKIQIYLYRSVIMVFFLIGKN